MPDVIFSVVDDVLGESRLVGLEKLKEYVMNIAQANAFELVDSEGWIEFINPGGKLDVGYALDSFKDGLSENTIFSLCTDILSVVDIDLYRVVYDSIKEKISWVAVTPGSKYDNEQILCQMGFGSSLVSKIDIYADDVCIGSCKSLVKREQHVRWYCDKNKNPVPVGQGGVTECILSKDPKRLLQLQMLQQQTGVSYLDFSGESNRLESHLECIPDVTPDAFRRKMEGVTKYTHSSIGEGMGFCFSAMREILKASAL